MASIVDYKDQNPPAIGTKTVLFFWAPWHEACASGGPLDQVMVALASSNAALQFGRIQAEDEPQLASKYEISVVPTFIFLDEAGAVVESIAGGDDVAAVTLAVQRLQANRTTGFSSTTQSVPTREERLSKRLDRLIRSSEVMLFMKGSPAAPRCGFSRQTVELLQADSIPFGSFDILTDEEVRQGLKKHSDWPTYPQLYLNGELIGGLDILKEMKEDGSLQETFAGAALSASEVDASGVHQSLDDRLKSLVKRSRVMLFMKGLPSAPRCGFSRQIVELLNDQGVSFDAFDILQDEDVRQGLKKLSDWPTYPQLYVEGELIGGLDIVKEMHEDGSLKEAL